MDTMVNEFPEKTGQTPATENSSLQPDIRPVDFSLRSSIALQVDDVGKLYSLGTINHGTLARDLQSWWARICGKEDPNLPVGASQAGAGRFWALKDVGFDVACGDTFGIIGKNGAGKSTLLKIMSRITSPTRGEVRINGRVASLLEVGTGFHPELTGRENVFLNGAILGMGKREIAAKFDEIVAFSGIEKFIDTPVKRYSSGMYVRLAFAVAAHLEPEILVIDEVLAVGDVEFQKKCLGKMEEIGSEGRTVLFVSHNMGSIKALCGRGLLLESGRLRQQGDIGEVVNAFLGDVESAASPRHVVEDDNGLAAQIREVSVADAAGGLSGNYPYDQVFRVNVEVEVRQPLSGVYLAAHIVDNDLQTVHFSRNFEPGGHGSNTLEPGRYVYSIDYPASLFVPDGYRVTVHLATVSPAEILDGVENVCKFGLYDSGSINAQKGFPWRGRIAVPVNWRTTKP